ncbi:MAG: tRNA (adenosine(37)-N6)-threonylcarbamoyltransferase complex dimerization subunit type 1 TsaB [Pyrinomonadaceae bacterium]|nr:tRNA (adenosine(37)-N6)-threonylcarbamoyltransferase complex dimerization subunit type 1 TsaB [Blastocatellia bacterium]MCW5958375.1 tRNA (adenosine(37)-N6)-threonylcarbamoyltransferase complex dimerization subunit type 1 TsaB [Pyrinomonadaceae bacterium]
MTRRSNKNGTILAIESGIRGGSLAVISGEEVIGEVSGDNSVSRAEDLLAKIDEIINSTVGSKHEIDSIAVSAGPGSFTGLRIGLATAMGLSSALGIRYSGIPLLRSMAETHSDEGRKITVVPIGKVDLCYQEFERKDGKLIELTPARTGTVTRFRSEVCQFPATTIIAHSGVIGPTTVSEQLLNSDMWIDLGSNLASVIGKYSLMIGAEFVSSPIYVQSPRSS